MDQAGPFVNNHCHTTVEQDGQEHLEISIQLCLGYIDLIPPRQMQGQAQAANKESPSTSNNVIVGRLDWLRTRSNRGPKSA
jgi:hypothetical protein